MQKYEIFYCLLAICFSSVAFKITIEDLNVHKIVSLKKVRLSFDSKRSWSKLKKLKTTILYYHNYKLPIVRVD